MATATLTTLTPVHVGSGQKYLRNFDFVMEGNRTGFIELKKVAALMGGDASSIDQLTIAIESKINLIKYLREKRGLKNIGIDDISYRISNNLGAISDNTNELKEQLHSSMKGPIIPGSSLKGALRTSILKYLTSEEKIDERAQRSLVDKVDWYQPRKIKFGKLDDIIFGETANAKSTRFLLVGDIQFDNTNTEIHELSYLNLRGDGWEFENRKAQLVECIPANSKAKFQLKTQQALADIYSRKYSELMVRNPNDRTMKPLRDLSFLGSNETDFLSLINISTRKILEWDIQKLTDMNMEDDYLEQLKGILQKVLACKEGEAIVRVGGHVGWSYMTNRWMIYSPEVLSDERFDLLQEASQRTNRYVGLMFPKTRKLTQNGAPLGFVKITLQP